MSFEGVVSGMIPQMILGYFPFSLNTIAYQELQRSISHRWASQEVFNAHEVLQYTGQGPDEITLPGVFYPGYKASSLITFEQFKILAADAQPMQMITATGALMGKWVVMDIQENQSNFAAFGVPKKVEFILKLRNYESGPGWGFIWDFFNSLFEE